MGFFKPTDGKTTELSEQFETIEKKVNDHIESCSGGGGNSIITDFEVSSMKEIQPTSFDLSTGIFTCDEVTFTGHTQIIPKEVSIAKFPKELILHNEFLSIVKLSDTTFKIKRGSSDISYSSDQTNVDVSDFKFSQGTSISIENIDMDDDGVYIIHLHALRGRIGQTNFKILDENNNTIFLNGAIIDGNPILFTTIEITIAKNKDIYSYGVNGRYAHNKIYGTKLGFDMGVINTQRDFCKTDKKPFKLRMDGSFVNGTRIWIEKVV